MRILSLSDVQSSPQNYDEIVEVLENDGVICFPTGGTYRLATPFHSLDAVNRFLQTKRRTRKAPALVFLPNHQALDSVAGDVTPQAEWLSQQYWPGALTLVFKLSEELPRKHIKNLNTKGRIGVRIPSDPMAQAITQAYGKPLLISSANIANKKGAHSEAQVRKNFGRWIDVLISAGDLSGNGGSTIIDMSKSSPKVMRSGDIDANEILASLKALNTTETYDSSLLTVSAA